jgi:hypothetical protein
MKAALIRLVWRRAKVCYEYCQMPQEFDRNPFEIDHIIADKHKGPAVASNLCSPGFGSGSRGQTPSVPITHRRNPAPPRGPLSSALG